MKLRRGGGGRWKVRRGGTLWEQQHTRCIYQQEVWRQRGGLVQGRAFEGLFEATSHVWMGCGEGAKRALARAKGLDQRGIAGGARGFSRPNFPP